MLPHFDCLDRSGRTVTSRVDGTLAYVVPCKGEAIAGLSQWWPPTCAYVFAWS